MQGCLFKCPYIQFLAGFLGKFIQSIVKVLVHLFPCSILTLLYCKAYNTVW